MKKQSGFTVVEILLVLLLVSFISFAGYYVWHSQQDMDSKEPKTQNAKSTDNDTASANETATWLAYATLDKKHGMKLPDGYSFEKSDDGLFLMALENKMTYLKGTKAVTGELLGRDAALGLFISFDAQSNLSESAKQIETLTTTSGISVAEYYQLYTEEAEGIGPGKGTKEYTFIAFKDDKRVEVRYASMNPDQLDVVKKMVKTISIN